MVRIIINFIILKMKYLSGKHLIIGIVCFLGVIRCQGVIQKSDSTIQLMGKVTNWEQYKDFPSFQFGCGVRVATGPLIDDPMVEEITGLSLGYCGGYSTWNGGSTFTLIGAKWGVKHFCPKGKYVTGFQVQVYGADVRSPFVGLKMICSDPISGQKPSIMLIKEDFKGKWYTINSKSNFRVVSGFKVGRKREKFDTTLQHTSINAIQLKYTDFRKLDAIMEKGKWGQAKGLILFDENYYGCGAQIKFEDEKKGLAVDNKAVTGIKFFSCDQKNWDNKREKSFQQKWGEWKEIVMCPKNWYVTGFGIRFQEPRIGNFGDDTAMNGLRIVCQQPQEKKQQIMTVYEGLWGKWRDINLSENMFLMGFQVQSQEPQARKDSTAVNGLYCYFKNINVAKK